MGGDLSRLSGYRRPRPGTQPEYLHPPYKSSVKRAPAQPLVMLPHGLTEITGPTFESEVREIRSCDLTRQHAQPPMGERIVVAGRVLDEDGRPLPRTLVEVWQANAAGRYLHSVDQHDAPLDPNFGGAGRILTDDEGRYRVVTIRPGAYPWGNHDNAWRPAHIHFSIFGTDFRTRLVTQMYFPDDPMFPYDPIMQSIRDERSRRSLISRFDLSLTQPEWALGFAWDIVVCGEHATPFEGRV